VTLYSRNRLKQKLGASQPALGFWLSLNSLAITEMAAGAGWDWLLLDMEHTIYNDESVERHLLAAHHGGDAEMVVRLPFIDAALVKRLMDMGVRSYMFPFVQTVEDARLAVQSTRYPPVGVRGFSGATRASRYGRDVDYLTTYAEDVCVIVQIETPQAIANIQAFGEVDGLDAMLIGANDLAANMGHLGDTRHGDVVRAVSDAGHAIRATGKASGFQFFDERAATLLEEGFTLAAVAGDLHTVSTGMDRRLHDFSR